MKRNFKGPGMFINKWMLIDAFDGDMPRQKEYPFCLKLFREPEDIGWLLNFLQEQPVEKPFSILLSGEDFVENTTGETYIGKLIALFFQPSSYLINYQPLLFLRNRTKASTTFLERLQKEGKQQGIENILVIDVLDYQDRAKDQFAVRITTDVIDYDRLVSEWLTLCLADKDPLEIHLLVSTRNEEIPAVFNSLFAKEKAVKETGNYQLAYTLYRKQKLIDEYRHQLSLKMIDERDSQVYLSIQKEERRNGLQWYYYEYEILPLWYKQFGHLLKVIMGKRSFKSLFSDNVKKYKD
jgi:hypothetical protein